MQSFQNIPLSTVCLVCPLPLSSCDWITEFCRERRLRWLDGSETFDTEDCPVKRQFLLVWSKGGNQVALLHVHRRKSLGWMDGSTKHAALTWETMHCSFSFCYLPILNCYNHDHDRCWTLTKQGCVSVGHVWPVTSLRCNTEEEEQIKLLFPAWSSNNKTKWLSLQR